jgi:hypothetical protein
VGARLDLLADRLSGVHVPEAAAPAGKLKGSGAAADAKLGAAVQAQRDTAAALLAAALATVGSGTPLPVAESAVAVPPATPAGANPTSSRPTRRNAKKSKPGTLALATSEPKKTPG